MRGRHRPWPVSGGSCKAPAQGFRLFFPVEATPWQKAAVLRAVGCVAAAVPATSLLPRGPRSVCQRVACSWGQTRPTPVPLCLASAAGAQTAARLEEKQTV